jgi:hypothetical protein
VAVRILLRPCQPRLPRDRDRHPTGGEGGARVAGGEVHLLDGVKRQAVLVEHVGEEPLAGRALAHGHRLPLQCLDRVDFPLGHDAVATDGGVEPQHLNRFDPARVRARERVGRRRDRVEAPRLDRIEALHRILDDFVRDLEALLLEHAALDPDHQPGVAVPGREREPDRRMLDRLGGLAAGLGRFLRGGLILATTAGRQEEEQAEGEHEGR